MLVGDVVSSKAVGAGMARALLPIVSDRGQKSIVGL